MCVRMYEYITALLFIIQNILSCDVKSRSQRILCPDLESQLITNFIFTENYKLFISQKSKSRHKILDNRS